MVSSAETPYRTSAATTCCRCGVVVERGRSNILSEGPACDRCALGAEPARPSQALTVKQFVTAMILVLLFLTIVVPLLFD
jgi:hypothetical protein